MTRERRVDTTRGNHCERQGNNMQKLKAICYINQFFAGMGGEEMAHEGLHIMRGAVGPATGMVAHWDGDMEVVSTIVCGDNFINLDENFKAVEPQILSHVKNELPDIFIAGPAFNAGRYGVACGKMCELVATRLGVPTVTSMYPLNPAVDMYFNKTIISIGAEKASGMRASLPALAKLALKLAKKTPLAPASADGYIATGKRKNEVDEHSAAERVVDLLMRKLSGGPYVTEVPLRKEERVPATAPAADFSKLRFALVTMGGLVPKGNPDKLRQYASVSYGTYAIDPATFNEEHYESVHGGYDTTAVNRDPQRLVPYAASLGLQKRGLIGSVADYFISTCGIGTNVGMAKKLGAEMAEQLLRDEVGAAFLTST